MNCEGKEPIAIIGMSVRLPQCNTLSDFWSILEKGENVTSHPPDYRWRQEDYCHPIPKICRETNAGFISQNVDEFAASFFEVNPKDAVFTDPQHRIMYELVWEGLEDAGIDPHSLNGTKGSVFSCSWLTGYQDILLNAGYHDFYMRYMGNSFGAGAAKISYFLGLTGPSISAESGCSSSMVSVHLACSSLRKKETNMALVCAMNLLMRPFHPNYMGKANSMFAPDGKCKPFDKDCNGFGRCEGGGCLVLKRLSDAVNDGDRIWAVIRGTGTAQEGTSSSLGTPTVENESMAMMLALKDADVDPSDVTFIEAHGTGTVVGDPIEISAIRKAYSGNGGRQVPLIIGSVKGNISHAESSSGMIGIMKVALALNHRVIPKQANLSNLNPALDLKSIPAEIPQVNLEWKSKGDNKLIAGVSSFGITGTDAHIILEEPPKQAAASISKDRPSHLIKVSATTIESLNLLLLGLKKKLEEGDEELCHLAYTANTGRANFKLRGVIIADTKESAIASITSGKFIKGEVEGSFENKICFLFTGQGSQYPGMGKMLYETSPTFKIHFDHCAFILKNRHDLDIKEKLWHDEDSSHVNETMISQTGIFCVEYALLKLWESWGIKPDYVLGHSTGEFASAVCSGILSVEDALFLVAERSRLIEMLPHGKMLVLKASKKEVDSVFQKFLLDHPGARLDFAAINSKEQTVIAGNPEVIISFAQHCDGQGIKNLLLQANHAFHSRFMDPMLKEYGDIAQSIRKRNGKESCKYISGMKGRLISTPDEVNWEYWVDHTRQPVLFLKACETAVNEGCRIFVEIGPQPVLSALMTNNSDEDLICLPSLRRNSDEWSNLLSSLGKLYVKGVNVDWKGFDKLYKRIRACLPHYPFIRKRFWPEIRVKFGESTHPLIGTALETPTSTKMFESNLFLNSVEYVKDHVAGNEIIFPGAGFLEMALASGMASTSPNNTTKINLSGNPVVIRNLRIEAPLLMQESSSYHLFTTVEFGDAQDNLNGIPIKILRKHKESSSPSSSSIKWITHATAQITRLFTNEEKKLPQEMDMHDTKQITGDKKFIQDAYSKLSLVGVKFGPNFRSLEESWHLEWENKTIFKLHSNIKKLESESNTYVHHPVILDAMVQAIIFSSFRSKWANNKVESHDLNKIHLLAKIGKFVQYSKSPEHGPASYIHVLESTSEDDLSGATAFLTNSMGNVKCVISSVEIIETTPNAFKLALRRQSGKVEPDLWEQTWNPVMGALNLRVDLSKLSPIDSEILRELRRSKTSSHYMEVDKYMQEFSYLNITKALRKCGWLPEAGASFHLDGLMKQCRIQGNHRLYFKFMLKTLSEEGILSIVDNTNQVWKINKLPPSITEIKERLMLIDSHLSQIPDIRGFMDLTSEAGRKLGSYLQGIESPLPMFFPDDENAPSASKYYNDFSNFSKLNHLTSKFFSEIFSRLRNSDEEMVLRILEVGGGTGGLTSIMIPILSDFNILFEYTFTDVSPAFFVAALKKFHKYRKHMIFKKLNLDEEPLSQGFQTAYYDVIIAYEVIHATKSISTSINSLNVLLKPSGYLNLIEGIQPSRNVTFVWGLLPGYWAFQDFDLRTEHCTISSDEWIQVLNTSGFEIHFEFNLNDHEKYMYCKKVMDIPALPQHKGERVWLVMQSQNMPISMYLTDRFQRIGRKVTVIEPSDLRLKEQLVTLFQKWSNFELEGVLYLIPLDNAKKNQRELLKPLFEATKILPEFLLQKQNKPPKFAILTRESEAINENDNMCGFQSSTLSAFCKAIKNENVDLQFRIMDIDREVLEDENLMEQVFQEIFYDSTEEIVAFRESSKYVPKVKSLRPTSISNQLGELEVPWNRFQLVIPDSRLFNDFLFGYLDEHILGDTELEVEVKVTALNFRDIFSVIKPTDEFRDLNDIGLDFSGEVKRIGGKVSKWKCGDLVYGLNLKGGALPSHVVSEQDLLLKVPENVSLFDITTLLGVSLTAYVSLVDEAKIRAGETCLIHTGTGGVGLAAIQICKYIGARIIATAGSKVKRRYLRKVVGIKHVFHSRNTSYLKGIMEVTNGRGVDVVLNTLTGNGLKEASLNASAKGSRFIEISKLNVWTDKDVKKLRDDVQYTIVDLAKMDVNELKIRMEKTHQYLMQGFIKPLPYTNFNAVNIKQAWNYLQKAKQIGKVLITMPKFQYEGETIQAESIMFCDRSTYLITGGLGGIGFTVCKWMLGKGARNIILAGRSYPSPDIEKKIAALNSKKVHTNVVFVQLNVGSRIECEDLISSRMQDMSLPPLKGIMHAAGVLADDLHVNQEWERFSSTFTSKVEGTLNLHEVTKSMNLEFFILFSSISSIVGAPGQSNHAAANKYLDGFAHYLRSIGLKATSINYGMWGEVGIATEADSQGMRPLSTEEGLLVLEHVMKSQLTQIIAFSLESLHVFKAYVPIMSSLLHKDTMDKLSITSGGQLGKLFTDEEFFTEIKAAVNKEDKVKLIQDQVNFISRSVLGLSENDEIRDEVDFRDLGIDSLMQIEIRNGIQSLLGDKVKLNGRQLKESRNVKTLCDILLDAIEGQGK